jgi:hypothetical protein
MLRLFDQKINLGFIVNPFYLYCIAFTFAIIAYSAGWSNIFPKLSAGLLLFFAVTFVIFILAGYLFVKKQPDFYNHQVFGRHLNDIIFWLIILLGVINILYMGYLPVLDRSHNYREFGMPVIDPLFNSLSIFFSVFFFHSFLDTRKKRLLIYLLIILIFQAIIFRRSAIMWIIISSSFLFILYIRKIRILVIILSIVCIPVLSYCFGLYGNFRSSLTKSFVINDLGASDTFRNSGISFNHYMTYLYLSSPLANLQENIDRRGEELKNDDFKDFLFYCLVPQSFTLRLQKPLHLLPPATHLISPNLIAGTFYMVSFYTLGWTGMISMVFFLFLFIILCLLIIKRWNICELETLSLLSATVCMLIFSNFLNRLDVLLMLFVYPVLFHFFFNIKRRRIIS